MSRTGSSNGKTHEKEEGKIIDQVNRIKNDSKEKDNFSIQNVWLGSVYD